MTFLATKMWIVPPKLLIKWSLLTQRSHLQSTSDISRFLGHNTHLESRCIIVLAKWKQHSCQLLNVKMREISQFLAIFAIFVRVLPYKTTELDVQNAWVSRRMREGWQLCPPGDVTTLCHLLINTDLIIVLYILNDWYNNHQLKYERSKKNWT